VNRPELERMIDFARDGDTVLVHSIDRMDRNLDDLRAFVRRLTRKKVRVEFVKEQLTFTGDDNAMATLLLKAHGLLHWHMVGRADDREKRQRVAESREWSLDDLPLSSGRHAALKTDSRAPQMKLVVSLSALGVIVKSDPIYWRVWESL
jgi:hypothetical protein